MNVYFDQKEVVERTTGRKGMLSILQKGIIRGEIVPRNAAETNCFSDKGIKRFPAKG